MVEVFFCTSSEGRDCPDWLLALRQQMSQLCYSRWTLEDVKLILVHPEKVRAAGYHEPFQKARRQYADDHAEGDCYVLTDDDMLLQSGEVVAPMMDLLRSRPDIASISLHGCVGARCWKQANPPPDGMGDGEINICGSSGGVRFMQKGILKEWPPMGPENPYQYDVLHGAAMKAAGYDCAYTTPRTYTALHLGAGYSMTWASEKHLKSA